MAAPYRTESGDLADKDGNPIRAYRGRGLERIDALAASLTAEEVLKAVSAHAVGLLRLSREQQASLYKLGEAYRLWGARSEGVKAVETSFSIPGCLLPVFPPHPVPHDLSLGLRGQLRCRVLDGMNLRGRGVAGSPGPCKR